MNYRSLGRTGIMVSEIGLGCSSLGRSVFQDETFRSQLILKAAFDRGVTFFDTAGTYGYGTSEEILGNAFKKHRHQVIIASKGGQLPTTLGRYGKLVQPVVKPIRPLLRSLKASLKRRAEHRYDFSSDHLTHALEMSLRRLQTDYIDVYQLHSPPREALEQGDVFELLNAWKTQGKIRFAGVSARNSDDGLFCLVHGRIDVLQIPFNLLERTAEDSLLPTASAKNVGIVARVPFGRGLLTDSGRVATGLRTDDPTVATDAARERQRLQFLFEPTNLRTRTQTALRYILDHHEVSTVIPGTISVAHLDENLSAAALPPLTENENLRIRNR